MPHELTFQMKSGYDTLESGIELEARLQLGGGAVVAKAKVATGAQVCLFTRELGERLGLNIESGLKREFSTLTGQLTAYGPEVNLITLGIGFYTFVHFSQTRDLPRNLLGREGWLRLLRLAVIDYDSEIYLSPYDQV